MTKQKQQTDETSLLTPEQQEKIYQDVLKRKLEAETDIKLEDLSKENFVLELKRIPLTIGGKNGYFLEELDGSRRDAYNKELYGNHMTRQPDGNFIVTNHEGFYAILLQHCIIKPDGKYADFDEVQSWPSHVQDRLYRAARKLSGLDPKAKEDARKNSE